MFSMIRPIEELMAIERTPTEPDLRTPRRHRRELNSFLWLCGWGGVTAIALTAFAIASQTDTAGKRLRRIFAIDESSAIARMPPRVAQLETETQLLTAQIRSLTTEHDRLAGRIALLESSIDDMTGTIKKQAAATAALAGRTASSAPGPATSVSSVTFTSPQAGADPLKMETNVAANPLPKADVVTTQAAPLSPTRVATVSITEPDPPSSKPQSEFGLDLGGATTVEAVRQRWSVMKANFGPLLSGMHPRAARDARPGGVGYRLVVGPLPNSTSASGLCAHFTAAGAACRPVKFNGEPIAQ